MNTIKHPTFFLTMMLMLTASPWSLAQRAGQSVSVQYGVVTAGHQVELHSNAVPAGAMVGGTLGLISASGKRSSKKARNTLVGAAAGGLLAGAARGDRQGMVFEVQLTGNAGAVQIVTDQREVRLGDCVAVERAGETANIRRVSDAFCQSSNQPAVAAVAEQTAQDARECHAAKQAVVDAKTGEDAELAGVKVRLLCNN